MIRNYTDFFSYLKNCQFVFLIKNSKISDTSLYWLSKVPTPFFSNFRFLSHQNLMHFQIKKILTSSDMRWVKRPPMQVPRMIYFVLMSTIAYDHIFQLKKLNSLQGSSLGTTSDSQGLCLNWLTLVFCQKKMLFLIILMRESAFFLKSVRLKDTCLNLMGLKMKKQFSVKLKI